MSNRETGNGEPCRHVARLMGSERAGSPCLKPNSIRRGSRDYPDSLPIAHGPDRGFTALLHQANDLKTRMVVIGSAGAKARQAHEASSSRTKSTAIHSALSRISRSVWLVAIGLVTCILHTPQLAAQMDNQLKIVDEIWGFDGRVQPGQFNPVSILVDNLGDEPVEAMASFQEAQGLLVDTGGKLLQPVYIAPHSRRWVQFYPYVANMYQTSWRLRIGKQSFDPLQQPRATIDNSSDQQRQSPQAVILDPPNSLTAQPRTVKHFPENIFPPYSTATFGLHTVFMDHEPDWERPRQQAFMSWLKLGGRVHILKNRRGDWPQFSGVLAELDQPFESFRIGSGAVTRHDIQRADLSAAIVNTAVGGAGPQNEQEDLNQAIQQQSQLGNNHASFTTPSNQDGQVFQTLREITQPEHAWWLIFLLAVAYIGMIFPGCWILSQKKHIHFLATYGAIAGLSVIFSVMFLLIGRRGYGESTTLHTLAVARMEDDTHANVFQWNALFVTSGDTYNAGEPDEESVFATASGERSTSVDIVAGNAGGMKMQIPPFSAQTFLSRRRITVPGLPLTLQDVELNQSGLKSLTVKAGETFNPSEEAVFRAIAGSRIYRLAYDTETRTITQVGAISRLGPFTEQGFEQSFTFGPFGSTVKEQDGRTEEQRFYEESLPDLVRRSLLDDLAYNPDKFELPADRIRLLIYSPIPDDMQVPTDAATRKVGRVLFVKDLFLGDMGSGEESADE